MTQKKKINKFVHRYGLCLKYKNNQQITTVMYKKCPLSTL